MSYGLAYAGAESEYNDAEAVIFGIPYDHTACFKAGAREAPTAIRRASYNFEEIHFEHGIHQRRLEVYDYGNCDDFILPEDMFAEVDFAVRPAINDCYQRGILAFGPFPADGFFASGNYARYDAVLAMYHDQGLAPFKTLSPDGVNVTAGLDRVRTSPDHGVAYDIAGKDLADPQSLRNAIYMAADIVENRRRWAEMSADPLQHFEREKGRDTSAHDLPEAKNEKA